MNLPLLPIGTICFAALVLAMLATVGITRYWLGRRDAPSPRRRWIIGSLLGIFLLLFVVIPAVSSLLGRHRLQQTLAALQQRHIPVNALELSQLTALPPKAKESDNGRYFYAAAAALAQTIPMEKIDSGLYLSIDFFQAAPADRDKAFQVLNAPEADQALALFHRGAEKPFVSYNRDYSAGVMMPLPELMQQRRVYRLLSAKSVEFGVNGNPAAGYRLLLDGLRGIKQLEPAPTLIEQLVNIACTGLDLDALNILLAHGGIATSDAQSLLAALAALDFRHGMQSGLNGEIVLGSDCIGKLINQTSSDMTPITEEHDFMLGISLNFLLTAVWYWDWNYDLTQLEYHRKLYDRSYWEITGEIARLQHRKTAIPYYFPLSQLMLPVLTNCRIKTARVETEVEAARLSLALHIYKNRHGAFPEKLSALAPEVLPTVPVDPITGKPFEYRKTAAYFTLSSAWLEEKAKQAEQRNKTKVSHPVSGKKP